MSTKAPTACSHCHRDLATEQRGKHCPTKTCTWIKHGCGAMVDCLTGQHVHSEDTGKHINNWACRRDA